MQLWEELPDPLALIRAIAFDDADEAELATAVLVLQSATQRPNDHLVLGGQVAQLAVPS